MYRSCFPLLFPFAPIVTRWFYRGACGWKTKLRRSVSKGGVFLCGLQETLASGFHLKHKGVFLPDLYSFTQWVGQPLLFPSKESPDKTFVRSIIEYVHVASSSTNLGVQPWALSRMDFFFPSLFVHVLKNLSDKCLYAAAASHFVFVFYTPHIISPKYDFKTHKWAFFMFFAFKNTNKGCLLIT